MHISVSHVALRVRYMLHVASHCMLHYPVVSALFFRLQSTHASSHYKKLKFCGPPFFFEWTQALRKKTSVARKYARHTNTRNFFSFCNHRTPHPRRSEARRAEPRLVAAERAKRAKPQSAKQRLLPAPVHRALWTPALALAPNARDRENENARDKKTKMPLGGADRARLRSESPTAPTMELLTLPKTKMLLVRLADSDPPTDSNDGRARFFFLTPRSMPAANTAGPCCRSLKDTKRVWPRRVSRVLMAVLMSRPSPSAFAAGPLRKDKNARAA